MQSLKTVFTNSLEDTTDDFISNYLFMNMRNFTQPILKTGDDLTLKDEAINNFITQLSFGATLWAYTGIMAYITKVATRTGIMWGYIVSGKLKKKIQELKTKNIKGKKALNFLGAVIGSDKTLERIEVMKIADSNLRQIDTQIQNEKNNRLAIENKIVSLGATSTQLKGVSSQENFNLYLHKTKTSTWKNTNADKKLFEKVTGQPIAESGISWPDMVDTINNYSEFAKDVEGRIFNLTEAILKIVNRTNLAK